MLLECRIECHGNKALSLSRNASFDMKEVPTLLRIAEHNALRSIRLDGSILDLGGDSKGTYRTLIQGNHTWHTVNLDPKTNPDLLHDLEVPLPLPSSIFDHAVLMNVLEHVYNYDTLIQETVRVVKAGGQIVIVVPFLFPVHPSPNDFHRFTSSALKKRCAEVGIQVIEIIPLGTGVLSAQYVLFDRLLPYPIRLVRFFTLRYVVRIFDYVLKKTASLLNKKYDTGDYALGYVLRGKV